MSNTSNASYAVEETLGRDRVSATYRVRDGNGRRLILREFEALSASYRRALPLIVQAQRSLHLEGVVRPLAFHQGERPRLVYRLPSGVPLSQMEFSGEDGLAYAASVGMLLARLHARSLFGIELRVERLLVESRSRPMLTGLIAAPDLWDLSTGLAALLAQRLDVRADLHAFGLVLEALADRIRGEQDRAKAGELRELGAGLRSARGHRTATLDEVLTRLGGMGAQVEDVPHHSYSVPDLAGRETLLRELEASILRLSGKDRTARPPALFAITGRPGAGKTRVVAALAERALQAGCRVLATRARPGDRRLLGPVDDLLREARVEPSSARDVDQQPLSPDSDRHRRIEAAVDGLHRAVGDQPTLVLVEDIEVLPPAGLDALTYLVRELGLEEPDSPRMAVVVSARPVVGSDARDAASVIDDLREEGFAERIRLPPLDADAATEVLTSLGVSPGRNRDLMLQLAQGNARHLVDLARLSGDRGEASVIDPHEAIRRRVLRSDDAQRQVLNACAVLDRPAELPLIAALLPVRGRATAYGTVLQLVTRGLLLPGPELTFELERDAVDVVLEAISSRRLRHLHRRAGYATAELVGDSSPEVLARHFEQGGLPELFLIHGRQAAELLQRDHANELALELYERLLPVVPGDQQELHRELLEHCAALRSLVGDFAGAVQALNELLALPRDSGKTWQYYKALGRAYRDSQRLAEADAAFDTARLEVATGNDLAIADLLSEKAVVLERLGDAATARGLAEMAGALAERVVESREVAEIRNRVGATFRSLGDHERAAGHFEAGLRISERVGALENVARALNNLGNYLGQEVDRQRGLECCLRSLEIWEKLGDQQAIAQTTSNVGALYLRACELDSAERYLETGLRIGRRFGRSTVVMNCLGNLAELRFLRARYGEALEARLRTMKLAERFGRPRVFADQLFVLARDYVVLGCPEQAERIAGQLLDLSRRREDSFHEALAQLCLAGACRLRRQRSEARALLIRVEKVLRDLELDEFLVTCLTERADLEVERMPETAIAVAEEAAALATRYGFHRDRALSLLLVAEGYLKTDRERAERALREAEGISGELDQPELSWRCEYLAGDLAFAKGDESGAARRYGHAREILERIVAGFQDPGLTYGYMRDRRRLAVLRRSRDAAAVPCDSSRGDA